MYPHYCCGSVTGNEARTDTVAVVVVDVRAGVTTGVWTQTGTTGGGAIVAPVPSPVEPGSGSTSASWSNSECSSPAKRRRYGKTNLAQCSKSGSGKSMGHVSIFRGDQPVNNQQSSEAEDDQLTQVSELEIENISSTVFIL
jgi:hypothetical protein